MNYDDLERWAKISDCGRYRYALRRSGLGGKGSVLFVMLNPSTADDARDDPTLRRCLGFAQRWGYDEIWVGNVYAFRATFPKDLPREPSLARGRDNDLWLSRLAMLADRVVVGWGNDAPPSEAGRVARLLREKGDGVLWCWGRTASGAPKHPVRLANDTELVWWKG